MSEITIHTKYSKIPRIKLPEKDLIWSVRLVRSGWNFYKSHRRLILVLEALNYREGVFYSIVKGNIPFGKHTFRFESKRNHCDFGAVKSQLPQPPRVAIFRSDFKTGKIFIDSASLKQLLPNPLGYPFLEIFLSCLLPSLNKGAMFHASGVVDNSQGYLFLGSQGKGKSTMLKLWQGKADIINDNHIIIKKTGDSFVAFPIPGRITNLDKAVLKGVPINKIFFLYHNSRNKIFRNKNRTQALFMLLSNCFSMIVQQENTIKFCWDIVRKVPCYSLGFIPDERIVDFIRGLG